jgi:hypothetical protein
MLRLEIEKVHWGYPWILSIHVGPAALFRLGRFIPNSEEQVTDNLTNHTNGGTDA